MAHLINKARRPRFEVHLKIYDLNNVPLVRGVSHIKWHLPHSIHSDHRGRTAKCPITHHRVEYNYSKLIPVRMAIDKTNALSECLLDFEIIQEFTSGSSTASGAGGTGSAAAAAAASAAVAAASAGAASTNEKITLGRLTLNLAEYVEESEAILRDYQALRGLRRGSSGRGSLDKTADNNNSSDPLVEEGIIRRYLLTDAKINSTLKISILVSQVDGERAFTAPPLKTAGAVFGGGILGGGGRGSGAEDFGQHFQDHAEQDTASLSAAFANQVGGDASTGGGPGANNSNNNNSISRDAAAARHEAQDVYRRALAASWACQPGELPADECIEDIFSGGDGFGLDDGQPIFASPGDITPRGVGTGGSSHRKNASSGHHRKMLRREDSESSNTSDANEFLRPGTSAGLKRNGAGGGSGRRRGGGGHVRQGSGESVSTLRLLNANVDGARPRSSGGASTVSQLQQKPGTGNQHKRDGSKDSMGRLQRGGVLGADGGLGMRRSSLASLRSLAGSSAMENERGRSAFKSAREVTEIEVREDFVAWKLPGTA